MFFELLAVKSPVAESGACEAAGTGVVPTAEGAGRSTVEVGEVLAGEGEPAAGAAAGLVVVPDAEHAAVSAASDNSSAVTLVADPLECFIASWLRSSGLVGDSVLQRLYQPTVSA
jgi:hypothetical protein